MGDNRITVTLPPGMTIEDFKLKVSMVTSLMISPADMLEILENKKESDATYQCIRILLEVNKISQQTFLSTYQKAHDVFWRMVTIQ